MKVNNDRLRSLILFLSFSLVFCVVFFPGSLTVASSLVGAFLSSVVLFLIFLFNQAGKFKTNLTYSSSLTKSLLFISVLIFSALCITVYQVFNGLGGVANFFDLTKFINIVLPFIFISLMPRCDVVFLEKKVSLFFKSYVFLSLFFVILQNIMPSFSFWSLISEGSHYKYLEGRPFGINGSPTQAALSILFVSFFFFIKKDYKLFFVCGLCLFLIQNKLTLLVFFFSTIYILLTSGVSKFVKLILLVFFVLSVLAFVSISSALAEFLFDSNRLVESNTYTHRIDLIFFIFDRLDDFHFLLVGFPDKSYWAEEFGAFDMMYALLIFRFGVFFFFAFILFLLYFSFSLFDKKSRLVLFMFVFGTAFTMIALFHSRYGILCSWIIAISYFNAKKESLEYLK